MHQQKQPSSIARALHRPQAVLRRRLLPASSPSLFHFHLNRPNTANFQQTPSFSFKKKNVQRDYSTATEHLLYVRHCSRCWATAVTGTKPPPLSTVIFWWAKSDNKEDKSLNCANDKATSAREKIRVEK